MAASSYNRKARIICGFLLPFCLPSSFFFLSSRCWGAAAAAPRPRAFLNCLHRGDVTGPPAGAIRTPSHLAYVVLQPGSGTRHPRPNSSVTVHYTGWTTDGKTFDSSITRGQPLTFELDGVIRGWTEGVQMMVEGEKCRFWIPANLAYEGMSGPQGMLVFDIELIRIES
jgi:FKBP-type peptidyl-prolyl cis-trans isomerase